MKICVVATSGKSLIDFRGALIKSLCKEGHTVFCVSIEPTEVMCAAIRNLGAEYIQVSGNRVGTGLMSGIKMIKDYKRVFSQIHPDICLFYMSKPIAFGGFAAVKAHVKHINILVNGLENAFYQHRFKDFVIRLVMSFFYKYVSKHSDTVFMQNSDDYTFFIKKKLASKEKLVIVNGSGVDMRRFSREPLPEEPVFLMVSRLLWTKGIREYLLAIKEVRGQFPDAKFMLVGGIDEADEGLSEKELNNCIRDYKIEYCGFCNDVRPYLKKCSVFVLPSYHEGIPRSVLEAMATGRAIITTDAPGCKETVENEENGFLVPVKDWETLATKMIALIKDPILRERMANNSYKICKEKFNVDVINEKMISIIIGKANNNKAYEKLTIL